MGGLPPDPLGRPLPLPGAVSVSRSRWGGCGVAAEGCCCCCCCCCLRRLSTASAAAARHLSACCTLERRSCSLSLSKVGGWGWWLGGANPMDVWCGGATHWGDNGNQGLFDSHRGGGCHCAPERCCSCWSVCAVSRSVLARSWKSLCKALSLLPCTVVHSSGSGGPRGDPWLPLPAALLGCCWLPDSLTGREDLEFLMAAGFWFPRPEPPGRFPLWSVRGFRPGRFPFACSCAGGVGASRPPH